ncbi:MAG: UDP-N-acetylmuramate--L-alanine ligase [Chitinophagales bacterium]|nr:UDP-N-acetylmuramate--L-alanine ligase [Chitinophagales bacterium]
MIDINNISRVYFLGIGGIGMSALARYFIEQGKTVSGYDKTPSPLTEQLQKEGMNIHFEDDINLLDKHADLVIYTPAIPKDHLEMNWYLKNGFTLYKRSQVLGFISQNKFTIAVAGSHGKTTVSAMIAHILNQAGGCTAFLGGIASNYNSNYIHTSDKYVVVEADEFDRSFLTLHPNIAVITAIDSDHLEIYGSLENIEKEFIQFTNNIEENGVLVLNDKYKHINNQVRKDIAVKYYGQDLDSDFVLKHYEVRHGLFHFFVEAESHKLEDLVAHFGGIHNLENATAAIAVCKTLGLHDEEIRKGILTFKGIKRRFEKLVEVADYLYYDDYAHHPEEINALLNSLRFLYPKKEIVAVFQPHLFTRTQDLHKEFAAALSKANEVLLLPIYPARELPIEGVSASLILNEIKGVNKQLVEKENLLEIIKSLAKNKVIVTIGAGDIDRFVEPIKQMLSGK